jgi:hypothetical protein
MRKNSPTATDSFLLRFGFDPLRTDEPRSPESPNSLFRPVESDTRIEGEFGGRSLSTYTWLATHPKTRLALWGAALGGLAFGAVRILQPRPSLWTRFARRIS